MLLRDFCGCYFVIRCFVAFCAARLVKCMRINIWMLQIQGHSTNLFLQISVLGTTSCWLANYFCVATLLGNNHWRFFPGKIISRWRRPGLKDWSLLRDWDGAVAADRTNCFSRKPFPPKNFGGYGLRSRLRPFTSVYRSVHYGFSQTKGRHDIALLCFIHDQLFNTCEARWRKVILQLLSCFTHRIMNHGHAAQLPKAEILNTQPATTNMIRWRFY